MISTTAELEELIDGTVSIPTIPTVLTEITNIFNSPDGSAKDAAHVIEKDAAIATRVLRLVNSPFYGLKNPVSNINLACSILGLKAIKNLVVQATVLQTFGSSPAVRGFDANWLWDHSFKTAVACKMIAERSPANAGMQKDDAYTCGLIHDIGKLILIDSQSDRFGESLELSKSKKLPLAKAEAEVFGFNLARRRSARQPLETRRQRASRGDVPPQPGHQRRRLGAGVPRQSRQYVRPRSRHQGRWLPR